MSAGGGPPDVPLSAARLTTSRLLLRPVGPGDAAALFAVFGDPEVMRFWSSPAWTDPAQAAASIADDVADAAAGRSVRLAVLRHGDDGAIGTASVFALDRGNRRAEVGYALRRDAWGHGYATEAVAAVVAWAFGDLGLHRLEADIDPRNTASAAVLTRLGFRLEGLLRERWFVAGEVSDSAMYGLLAREAAAPTGRTP